MDEYQHLRESADADTAPYVDPCTARYTNTARAIDETCTLPRYHNGEHDYPSDRPRLSAPHLHLGDLFTAEARWNDAERSSIARISGRHLLMHDGPDAECDEPTQGSLLYEPRRTLGMRYVSR